MGLAHSLISQPLGYCYAVRSTQSGPLWGDSLNKTKQEERKTFRSRAAAISCRFDLSHHHNCAIRQVVSTVELFLFAATVMCRVIHDAYSPVAFPRHLVKVGSGDPRDFSQHTSCIADQLFTDRNLTSSLNPSIS